MVAEAVAADVVLKKRPQNLSIPNATAVDMAAMVAVCPPGILEENNFFLLPLKSLINYCYKIVSASGSGICLGCYGRCGRGLEWPMVCVLRLEHHAVRAAGIKVAD